MDSSGKTAFIILMQTAQGTGAASFFLGFGLWHGKKDTADGPMACPHGMRQT